MNGRIFGQIRLCLHRIHDILHEGLEQIEFRGLRIAIDETA
jgi:hypothetical protein